jgi:hypothetical protein
MVCQPDRERLPRPIERRVENLTAVGLRPLDPDFGPVVDQRWRRMVFDYMTAVYGRVTFTPDISMIYFANVRKRGRKNGGK